MFINKNEAQIQKIVGKHIQYLRSSIHSNDYFRKNNYHYFLTATGVFSVHLITEEQSSGSCWNEDDMEEPCQYEIKMSLVRNSIRYLLSVILPKASKKNLNSIADDILMNMSKRETSNYEYYQNYELGVMYSISMEKVYQLIEQSMWVFHDFLEKEKNYPKKNIIS